jgi:hypothetical protein
MQSGDGDWFRLWTLPVLLAGIALAFDMADRQIPFAVLATGPVD